MDPLRLHPTPFEIAEAALSISSTKPIRLCCDVVDVIIDHCQACPHFDQSIPHCGLAGCACEGPAKYFNILTSAHCPEGQF